MRPQASGNQSECCAALLLCVFSRSVVKSPITHHHSIPFNILPPVSALSAHVVCYCGCSLPYWLLILTPHSSVLSLRFHSLRCTLTTDLSTSQPLLCLVSSWNWAERHASSNFQPAHTFRKSKLLFFTNLHQLSKVCSCFLV